MFKLRVFVLNYAIIIIYHLSCLRSFFHLFLGLKILSVANFPPEKNENENFPKQFQQKLSNILF